MSKKRKQYSSEFKAKVALAAIRGEETVPQLAARHGLHPTQINSWKRQLIEQAAEVFSKDQSAGKADTSTKDDLHRVIGQLTVWSWSCPNLTDIFSWSRVSLDL